MSKFDKVVNGALAACAVAVIAMLFVGCGETEKVILSGSDGAVGAAGINGTDGVDGLDGADAAVLTRVIVGSGNCEQVAPGFWAESIHGSTIFDIYTSATCSDSSGLEQCDNVETSFPTSGTTGASGPGGGEVCWSDNIQFSGVKLANGDLEVYVLDFN